MIAPSRYRVKGSPVVPFAGFLLADVILAGLWVWDWRSGGRSNAFPIALAMLVAYHVSVMTFHRLPAWRAVGDWFVALPLS
jgi:hypothetical protein